MHQNLKFEHVFAGDKRIALAERIAVIASRKKYGIRIRLFDAEQIVYHRAVRIAERNGARAVKSGNIVRHFNAFVRIGIDVIQQFIADDIAAPVRKARFDFIRHDRKTLLGNGFFGIGRSDKHGRRALRIFRKRIFGNRRRLFRSRSSVLTFRCKYGRLQNQKYADHDCRQRDRPNSIFIHGKSPTNLKRYARAGAAFKKYYFTERGRIRRHETDDSERFSLSQKKAPCPARIF